MDEGIHVSKEEGGYVHVSGKSHICAESVEYDAKLKLAGLQGKFE